MLGALCKFHHIPFHCVGPWTTVDPKTPSGDHIEIEQRSAAEVLGFKQRWAPEGKTKNFWVFLLKFLFSGTNVFNPAFDVTPGDLVTSFVLDTGVLSPLAFREQVKK